MDKQRPTPRDIKRLLIANRGEIATRIISTARELEIETYALYTIGDTTHASGAAHSIEYVHPGYEAGELSKGGSIDSANRALDLAKAHKLPSGAVYNSINALIGIVKEYKIDAVHPGYGFLSESEEFAKRMWNEADAMVIGPGWGILANTGDKLKARMLAESCHVPVSPALLQPTNSTEDIRSFANKVGYPIMVKAVDGGGGRGIRLIRSEDQLEGLVKRAVEESPKKRVFAEQAVVDGFRHIEVQIIGDGSGVTHLWERDCSIQRRYQKIVEIAPSVVSDRELIETVILDALRMAAHIQYFSLGTFEFLVNPSTKKHFFLEVNPRLQVEHTITESISMTDIVKAQILLAQGASLADCGLGQIGIDPKHPPTAHSIQLRVTAENAQSNWSLSIGKITSFRLPTGNGVRTDTHMIASEPLVVSADFDSLLAKIIVTASSWQDAVRKARRALDDTQISGIKTNIGILRAIVAHPDFLKGKCGTQWLESKHQELLDSDLKISSSQPNVLTASAIPGAVLNTTTNLFRKGDAWSLTLSSSDDKSETGTHHLELTRILRNDFPTSLAAEILFSTPSSSTAYTVHVNSTTASASAATSNHRRGNPSDPSHIVIPFPGKLVEVLLEEGDMVKEGDIVCVVQQMKMELEVRAPRSGRVEWIMEVEDGEQVAEGLLAAVVVKEGAARL